MDPKTRLIPALDMTGVDAPKSLVEAMGAFVPVFKVHAWSDVWLASAINQLHEWGAMGVWADYKLHDTPDSVAKRAGEIKAAGADWVTVHAAGGPKMVEAAKKSGLYTIAVTTLTSLSDARVEELFVDKPEKVVRKLAGWAYDGGADALVCSPKQVATLEHWRRNYNPCDSLAIKLIVPGTRSAGKDPNDQAQVDTPFNAILNGADYLVVGRQVTEAKDPIAALQAIADEIAPAIEARVAAKTWRY